MSYFFNCVSGFVCTFYHHSAAAKHSTPLSVLSPVQHSLLGGDPNVVVSTAAFHARFRGSFPSLGGLKETKMVLPHPLVKLSQYCGEPL